MTKSMIRSTGPIIFVDDDLDDHYIYQEICHRLNIINEVKFFKNAEELLAYLRKTDDQPFIILCDINMPVLDGLTLRKRINSDEELKQKSIPFIFFSTAASKHQVRQAYDLTVQGFFLKKGSFIETEKTFKSILEYWDACLHPNSAK